MALYGKPSLTKLDKALTRLHEPMDRTAPIEVMLRNVEEIQMFLLANPDEDRQQKETQLITYALIKMANTGLYYKAIECWSGRDIDDRKAWADFRVFMIHEYERMLREGGGPTTGEDGWGSAFNATAAATEESEEEDSSLLASITTYAEHATAAEGEVSAMKGQLVGIQAQMAALMMNPTPHCTMAPPYVPQPPMIPVQMAMMGTQAVPPSIAIPAHQQQPGGRKKCKTPNANGPQQQQWAPPQQQGGAQPQMWQQQQWTQPCNPWQQAGGKNTNNLPNAPYSNTQKHFPNLKYCYSCGYDVDHDGYNCPDEKRGHIPNVHRDQVHLVPGARMRAQHKVLPDGTGVGKGWLLAQAANKGFFMMAQQGQQPWASIYQTVPQQQGRRRRS